MTMPKAKRAARFQRAIKLQQHVKECLQASSLDTSKQRQLCDQIIAELVAMLWLECGVKFNP